VDNSVCFWLSTLPNLPVEIMKKTGFIDGERVTLRAVNNSDLKVAVQATWWRTGCNVKAVTITYPMTVWANACRWVETADDERFRKAFEQLKQDAALVDMMENALTRAKEPSRNWRGMSGRK